MPFKDQRKIFFVYLHRIETVMPSLQDILVARFPIEFAPQKWIKSETTSKKLRSTA